MKKYLLLIILLNMVQKSSNQNFFIGLSLSNSSNYDSSVCVLDRNSKIMLLDKFYFTQDIDLFFKSSPYIHNSILCASVPYDNSLLEGKWRIHSKNYKMLGNYFKINRQKWTKRLSARLCDSLLNLREEGVNVFRCDINQLRQAYGLNAHYLSRTSLDCKNLQTSLKIKFGFNELPENMLAASSLEAIICAMFAKYIAFGGKTSELFEFEGIKTLSKPF